MITMPAHARQTDGRTDKQTDEHHGNSTAIRSNERIACQNERIGLQHTLSVHNTSTLKEANYLTLAINFRVTENLILALLSQMMKLSTDVVRTELCVVSFPSGTWGAALQRHFWHMCIFCCSIQMKVA